MINYNYKLERFENSKKIATFRSEKLPTELDDITYIEGPNSSGKSTLLHIFATAFYGLKNPEIADALKKKMHHLLDTKRNKLTFKIELSGKGDIPLLVAEKTNPDKADIDVFEIVDKEKKRITADTFDRKFNLIYDIPQDPTQRISQLVSEIEDMQKRYGDRVGELKEYIRGIVKEIESSKNPQSIKKTEESIKSKNKTLQDKEKELKKLTSEFNEVEKSVYTKYYFYYKEEKSKLWNQLMHLRNQGKKHKVKITCSSKDCKNYMNGLNKEIMALSNLQKEIALLFDLIPIKNMNELNVFLNINLEKVAEDLDFPNVSSLVIKKLIEFCSNNLDNLNKKDLFQKVILYKELSEVLEKYLSLKVDIPGTNKSIKDLLGDIKKSLKENEPYLKQYENLKEIQKKLKQFSEIKQTIEIDYLPTLRHLVEEKSTISSKEEVSTNKIGLMEGKHVEMKKKSDYYEERWAKIGRPELSEVIKLGTKELKNYAGFDEENMKNEISKMNSIINNLSSEIQSLKMRIELETSELKDLKGKKPHKYSNQQKKLNELYSLAEELEAKLKNEFKEYLKNLRGVNQSNSPINANQQEYNLAVFKYLGKRIEFYKHIDKYYEIDLIDLLEEVIITKSGQRIYFAEMGTGQSQSAYLIGKLNTSDHRPIIALFDEVAMMDEKSLEPIFTKCRELHEEGLLLAAIVVQKAKEIKIESKIK